MGYRVLAIMFFILFAGMCADAGYGWMALASVVCSIILMIVSFIDYLDYQEDFDE